MDTSSPRSPLDDGEIGDDESKEFDDGYDENLMGDEEDQKKLAQMTEKEREQELFNRSERRETLKIRFDIERKLRSKAKKRELEKKQSKQVRARKRLRASEIYSSDLSSEESDEYTPETNKSSGLNDLNTSGKPVSKMNTRSALLNTSSSSPSASSASSASSSSSSSESEQENDELEADEETHKVQDNFQMTLADLRSIQLKRDKIEKWVYAPFFRETAIGLFVKISVGNHPQTMQHMYKVAQITDITKGSRIYALNMGKHKTDKHCVVRIGRVERTYQMSFVSNRSFDEDDFGRWKDQIHIDGQDMPSREYFSKKKRDLQKAINYAYQDEDIAYEVTERSRFKDHPYNFALKKTELMGEKADAEASNDYERARQIQMIIDELEEKARELEKTRSSSTFSAMSYVNERNRYKNIVESERVLKESKSVKTEDPFTRRKCTPTIVHNKNNGDVLNSASDKNGQELATHNSNGNNKALAKPEIVKSVDDLFQAHANIDLELDIDI